MEIDHPYRFDGQGRTATTTYGEHVRDMLEQLLLTSPGERVNRPDLGANLLQLVFAPGGDQLAGTVEIGVRAAVGRWLGDVLDVVRLEVTADDAELRVRLDYRVRRTGELRTDVVSRRLP